MGLSQTQFARLVGVTKDSVSRQERGVIGIREPLARLIRILAQQGKAKGRPVKKR